MEKDKEKLDQFVLDIEFLLISVVQGVALAALAASAAGPIGDFKLEYFPYIISSFIFVLNFWSQAIIHTLSFIDWPFDLTHNFLYFLVSFVEVMAFSHLTDPFKWFGFISLFFVVAAFLYLFDFSLIKKHEKKFQDTKRSRDLFQHIVKRQTFELFTLLPLGLAYNVLSFVALLVFPKIFLENHYHVILALIQMMFGIFVMVDFMKSFKKRSALMT